MNKVLELYITIFWWTMTVLYKSPNILQLEERHLKNIQMLSVVFWTLSVLDDDFNVKEQGTDSDPWCVSPQLVKTLRNKSKEKSIDLLSVSKEMSESEISSAHFDVMDGIKVAFGTEN